MSVERLAFCCVVPSAARSAERLKFSCKRPTERSEVDASVSVQRLALSCGPSSLAKTLMLDMTAALAKPKAASHYSTRWNPVSSNGRVGLRGPRPPCAARPRARLLLPSPRPSPSRRTRARDTTASDNSSSRLRCAGARKPPSHTARPEPALAASRRHLQAPRRARPRPRRAARH